MGGDKAGGQHPIPSQIERGQVGRSGHRAYGAGDIHEKRQPVHSPKPILIAKAQRKRLNDVCNSIGEHGNEIAKET